MLQPRRSTPRARKRACTGVLSRGRGRQQLTPSSPHYHKEEMTAAAQYISSSSFNSSLSFEEEINQELMDLMDRMDSGALCSNPFASLPLSWLDHSNMDVSGEPLFSDPSPSPVLTHRHQPQTSFIAATPTNTRARMTTPITSPANTSRCTSVLKTPSSGPSHLLLTHWGLPDKVLQCYANRGVMAMFSWQADCLSLPGVLMGRNIVYSAPTSAGKTLVAELLALKCVLEHQKKVLLILPFVSLAQEKVGTLREVFAPVGVKVGGFMGSQSHPGGLPAVDIAVCTIEKANSMVNRLLEEGRANVLGAVVVDELHMIGDHHRGYLLELLLTKLMYVNRRGKLGSPLTKDEGEPTLLSTTSSIQIIGMSATLPNLDVLARWLDAVLYSTDYRPVPLNEMVKIGRIIYDTDLRKLKELDAGLSDDDEDILAICRERLAEGHSVLIFCPTKSWCEKLAERVAMAPFLRGRLSGSLALDRSGLEGVCEQLRRTQVGLDQILAKSVPSGVAFHHAGLTFDEREIVEGAFRQSLIKILVATSTLSSGVNLPARLVIIRTPIFHQSVLDVLVYKQMVGRAGRKGVDTIGESILICKPSERARVVSLLSSAPTPVQSCLGRAPTSLSKEKMAGKRGGGDNLAALKRAVLEVVASGTALTLADIKSYLSCTLLYTELVEEDKRQRNPSSRLRSPENGPAKSTDVLLNSTLQFLLECELISRREDKQNAGEEDRMKAGSHQCEYYATQFGSATMASTLSPDDALIVFSEFQRARRAFVLENELHIIYLVTPVYVQNQWPTIDWYRFLCLWERLPADMRHVANTVGIQESFLARAVQGRIPDKTPLQQQKLQTHKRFLTALALHDLVRETPIQVVSKKYGASKGLLQNLQLAAGTFAGMVTVFCSHLGWKNLELLLCQFQSRLTFGVERELCDLVRISLLNGCRARVLYNAGFHTLAALASANPITIETTLRRAFPFKSSVLQASGEQETGVLAVNWCAKLRKGMTESEAARLIVQEARHILSDDMNISVTAWGKAGFSVQPGAQTETGLIPKLRFKDKLIGEVPDTCAVKDDQLKRETRAGSVMNSPDSKKPLQEQRPGRKCLSSIQGCCNSVSIKRLKLSRDQCLPSNEHGASVDGVIEPADGGKLLHEVSLDLPPGTDLLPAGTKSTSDMHKSTLDGLVLNSQINETAGIADFSVSFSPNTLALIDAACNQPSINVDPSSQQVTPVSCSEEGVVIQSMRKPPSPVVSNVAAQSNVKNNRCYRPTANDSLTVKELSQLYSSSCSESGLCVVDVAANELLFETFLEECVEQKRISFSVASEKLNGNDGIGGSVIRHTHSLKGLPLPLGNEQVVGVAFSWGKMDVYYVSLYDSSSDRGTPLLDSSQVGLSPSIPVQERVQGIKKLLCATNRGECELVAYDIKWQCRQLMLSCDCELCCSPCDPLVADWLLDPDGKEKTLHRMVLHYLSDQPMMADSEEMDIPLSSLATNSPFPYMRASAECILADMLMDKMKVLLQAEELYHAFQTVEMPATILLAKMELSGIGFSAEECQNLRDKLQTHLSELEQEAYQFAGHAFALTSPEDVARVLFTEIKLPHDKPMTKTLGVMGRSTKRRVQHLSTAKDVLEKLCPLHPLPGVILEWRRVSNTITRTVYPLFKEAVTHANMNSIRIHASHHFHTATGRVSVLDPNLQNVPKQYAIGLYKFKVQDAIIPEFDVCQPSLVLDASQRLKSVSMRDVFKPFTGGIFLAADYSQLELRMLAHMSSDQKLQGFLNSDGDAFRMIAGEWLGVSPEAVTDVHRQQTKQVCYGMIYGIGARALAEQIGVSVEEASIFMETFKSKYPIMREFLTSTVQQCRDKGYVVTLQGRRRYLSHIHSTDASARTQAERQAVNSTIQGSAADLVKTAMINIDRRLQSGGHCTCVGSRASSTSAFLVLQLHDELLYEVHESSLSQVATIVRKEMESALALSVKFPVKLKTGHSWGQLAPYTVSQ